MSEQRTPYVTPTRPISGVCYVDDVPDVREYLINLRRDLLRKVRDLDELIARMPQDAPHA
jgi:hypothetical protein